MNIITEQLANKLPQNSKLQKYNIVNPTNFNQLHQLLKSNKIYEIYLDSINTDVDINNLLPLEIYEI